MKARYTPFRFLMLVLVAGTLATAQGRTAPFEPPTGEKESVLSPAKINVPPVRMGSDSPNSEKALPTSLAKPQRYVVDSTVPLVVAQFSIDPGYVKIVERKGPRPYSVHNTITIHKADTDNEDIVTVPGPYIYEVTHERDGTAFLEVFPAFGRTTAEGKIAPLTSLDIQRRTLTLGQGPRPPPDDPIEPDPEVRTLAAQLRTAYMGESASDKSTSVKELASLYRTMAKSLTANDASVAKLTTQLQFGEAMKAARSSLIGDKIPEVRNVVGDFFDKKWVVAENAKFDATAKGKAAASLNQAAKALEAIR